MSEPVCVSVYGHERVSVCGGLRLRLKRERERDRESQRERERKGSLLLPNYTLKKLTAVKFFPRPWPLAGSHPSPSLKTSRC